MVSPGGEIVLAFFLRGRDLGFPYRKKLLRYQHDGLALAFET
jgi:hypothetical protein